jgi:hypothetical protein
MPSPPAALRAEEGSTAISSRLGVSMAEVRHALRTLVNAWNTDPRQAAQQLLQAIGEVKRRIPRANKEPADEQRWSAGYPR